MVLTKSYLRYVPAQTLGIVSSLRSNGLLCKITPSTPGQAKRSFKNERQVAIAGALEDIIVWDCRTGEKVMCFLHLYQVKSRTFALIVELANAVIR